MTTGNVLYLLMTIGMFVAFSAVVGYQSWQQSRLGPEVKTVPDAHAQPRDGVPA